MTVLQEVSQIPATVAGPGYDPGAHGTGIVHIGLGAFMRAHLAVYTDDALAARGGDWRITCVGLRSREVVDAVAAQNGLYALLVRERETRVRVPGAIAGALHAPTDPDAVMAALTAPATRIVILTITEKGYGIDPATGRLDTALPDIAADLVSDLSAPRSAVGWIVAALARRRAAGTGPFTALSCDNLSENGALLKRLVLTFASQRDAALAAWIDAHVTFPSTMVDRITPAQTQTTLADARAALGLDDAAAVETEPFSQWIVEDDFCAGRPDWDVAGAVMVEDVRPYERMKLRMLNGAHSMLAYSGYLAGHDFVRDAMADPDLSRLVARHLASAAATLDPVPGIDLDAYASALSARFANPAIAHPTYQIAMDGTQKLPMRIFEPAGIARACKADIASFAFATAAWIAYTRGKRDDGTEFDLRDPRQAEIAALTGPAGADADVLVDALFSLPGFVPATLLEDDAWRTAVRARVDTMIGSGMKAAIRAEADAARS